MASTIKTLAPIKGIGVFDDCRVSDSPQFLQYNLLYGFNGSGKTTLSRIFASIESGNLRPELPKGGTFEVVLSDGAKVSSNGDMAVLSNRLLVFNSDFVDESFKWKEGTAKPIFYIGREQVEQATQLSAVSNEIKQVQSSLTVAKELKTANEKAFTQFKRDLARLISEELNLGRSYDATKLMADYKDVNYSSLQTVPDNDRQKLREQIVQLSPLPKRTPFPAGSCRTN